MKSSRSLSAYRIEIETKDGVVTLTGSVPNATQKREAVSLGPRRLRGVSGVVDQIRVIDNRVRPVQYQTAMGGGFHRGRGMVHHDGAIAGGGMVTEGAPVDAPSQPPARCPVMDGSTDPRRPGRHERTNGSGTVRQGNMPNYAWPSYAPTE